MDDLGNITTIISILAACLSVWFARSSAESAKKSLSIVQHQESRQKQALRPYVNVGYSRTNPDDKSRIYGFSLAISNPSDSDNSVVHLELRILYTNSQNAYMQVKLPHDDKLIAPFKGGDITPYKIPIRIDAHQAATGWALFRISDALLDGCNLDRYSLTITDGNGNVTDFEPDMVKELKDV